MTRHPRTSGARVRRGFTLVELLVSVALVVLMMAMFAEIYRLAAGAVSTQKGMGVNDQKIRTFTTLLRKDLDTRTFRDVMPYKPIDPSVAAQFGTHSRDLVRRLGYFLVSENDPDSQIDDVLAMTVDVDQLKFGAPAAALFGKATDLGTIAADFNQSAWDDGNPDNGLGSSSMAEIAYFLRNGNLYRSVMLIRQPYNLDGTTSDQPRDASDAPLIRDNNAPNAGYPNFWRDFDYSAFFDPSVGQNRALFATGSMLDNTPQGLSTGTMPVGAQTLPRSLGIPHLRYGHDLGDPFGRPVEFEKTAANADVFIGRFLKQEVQHDDFDYPGQSGALPSLVAIPDPKRPDDYYVWPGGTPPTDFARRGEELLIANVHEFDVQVWDDGLVDNGVASAQFVNLGYDPTLFGGSGYYARVTGSPVRPAAPHGTGYSATPDYGNRFDTWHPALGGPGFPAPAPYRGVHQPSATIFGVDGMPGVANLDDDNDGITDFDDVNANGVFDAGEEDADEVGWIGTDDERPLRAIRIRIRFYDPKSAQVRQLTLTHSLVDPKQET